jgi:hypothetical protein
MKIYPQHLQYPPPEVPWIAWTTLLRAAYINDRAEAKGYPMRVYYEVPDSGEMPDESELQFFVEITGVMTSPVGRVEETPDETPHPSEGTFEIHAVMRMRPYPRRQVPPEEADDQDEDEPY